MGEDRVTIQEAARRLGVTEGAIRKRVKRGSMEHEKGEYGRVYVYLDAPSTEYQDAGSMGESDALRSHLEDEITYLRDENRRKDEIIMQQAMTMRQLSAPTPEDSSRDDQDDGQGKPGAGPKGATIPETGEANSEPRRGWWRRAFGG